jgi:hypothetical protein
MAESKEAALEHARKIVNAIGLRFSLELGNI